MASVSIGDKGKMASVLGPTDEIVRRLPEIGGYLTPANMNSASVKPYIYASSCPSS